MVRVLKTIRTKYPDSVKLVLSVHDQIDTLAKVEVANEWMSVLQQEMEAAAKIIIPTGILKADPTISPVWKK